MAGVRAKQRASAWGDVRRGRAGPGPLREVLVRMDEERELPNVITGNDAVRHSGDDFLLLVVLIVIVRKAKRQNGDASTLAPRGIVAKPCQNRGDGHS